MSVRYIQLQAVSKLFSPSVRAFGNIAIIGEATAGTSNPFETFTDPDTAQTTFPGDLGKSIALAFEQTPGPTVVYGIRTGAGPDWTTALTTASTLDVQLVVLANTVVNATNVASSATTGTTTTADGAILQLSNHVTAISHEDGKERIGVAMLPKGVTDVSTIITNERMVYIAHKSDQDAAAAVAGTIAGYQPYVSLLLKQVNIAMLTLFTPAEILAINGSESFGSPPAGKGVNWLTSPSLIPGRGIYMGEGYTGDPGGGKKFIDIVRTLDDISFNLKAGLITSIGTLRISRSSLRSLIAQMEAILDPYVRGDILGSYNVQIPLLILLDKDPNTLMPSELQQIHNAEAQRLIQVLVTVEYQAAIHRLAITLQFE
jgi:hypothetical protein